MILSSVCLRVLFTILIFSFIEFVGGSELEKYGEPCESFSGCNILLNLQCRNGTCQCSSIGYKTYSSRAEVTCNYGNILSSFKKTCDPTCPSGQFCEDARCKCNNGTVKIGSECYEAVVSSPMEDCSVKEDEKKAYICDNSKFSFCQYPKCVCYSKYYYNFTTKACEARSSSPLYKGQGYRSMPNEYCAQESDCFEGLRCLKQKALCDCPSNCKYIEKYGSCDCGRIDFETPAGVLWIGILLGLASVIFWIWKIQKTYKHCKEKREELQEFPGSYSLQPPPMPQPTPQYSAGEANVNFQPSKVAENDDDPPAYPPPPPTYSSLGFAKSENTPGVSSSQGIPPVNFIKKKTDDLPYPVQPMSHGDGPVSNPPYSLQTDAALSKESDHMKATSYPLDPNAPNSNLEPPYPLAPPCPPEAGPDLNAVGYSLSDPSLPSASPSPFFPPPSAPTINENSASLSPSHPGSDYSPWKVASDTQPLNPDNRK